MEFQVTLLLDPQNPLPVSLHFLFTPSLRFLFIDSTGSPIAEDYLSSFDSLEFRDEPPLNIVFSGPSLTRSILFTTDEDSKRFIDALVSHVTINPNTANPSALSLVNDTKLFGRNSVLVKNVCALVDQLRPVDGIVSGTIDPSVPCQLVLFNIEAARGVDLKSANWAVLKVADDDWPMVFRMLLNAPRSDDYADLSKQWQLECVDQWERHFLLRTFVFGLDNWLSHSQLPSKCHKQAFFNVLMGLFTDSFGTLVLGDGLLFLCELMFRLFVRDVMDDGAFGLATGEVLPPIETEAFVFAHIQPIMEESLQLPTFAKEAAAIFSYLAEMSPSTALMLEERGLRSLEFCRNHCDMFFAQGRPHRECLILIAWALGSGDLAAFRKEMTSIALVLTQKKLQKVPLKDKKRFCACFASELVLIPARLLVWNSWKLRSKCIIK
jgi:hypothetical protein